MNYDWPHGDAFWRWAKRFERKVPGMAVTTCHSYEIFYKFRYVEMTSPTFSDPL